MRPIFAWLAGLPSSPWPQNRQRPSWPAVSAAECSRLPSLARTELWIQWRALLRDGGNAVRQEYLLEAAGRPLALEQTRLIELPAAGARIIGTAPDHPWS